LISSCFAFLFKLRNLRLPKISPQQTYEVSQGSEALQVDQAENEDGSDEALPSIGWSKKRLV
jgi:hypothetical protein